MVKRGGNLLPSSASEQFMNHGDVSKREEGRRKRRMLVIMKDGLIINLRALLPRRDTCKLAALLLAACVGVCVLGQSQKIFPEQ